MALQDAKIFIDIISPGSGRVAMYQDTQRDSQGNIKANTGKTFGPAQLIADDTVGAPGTGNTATELEPINPDFSRPYFTLRPADFSGTFVAGDNIIFQTHPAAMPLWLKEILPAGASAGHEEAIIAIAGESA